MRKENRKAAGGEARRKRDMVRGDCVPGTAVGSMAGVGAARGASANGDWYGVVGNGIWYASIPCAMAACEAAAAAAAAVVGAAGTTGGRSHGLNRRS